MILFIFIHELHISKLIMSPSGWSYLGIVGMHTIWRSKCTNNIGEVIGFYGASFVPQGIFNHQHILLLRIQPDF